MTYKKEDIESALDIPDYYREHVKKLKVKDNGQGMGLCPFHDDHKPSLSVNTNRGAFHCYVCGAEGSVFDFEMRLNGIDFKEALHSLGARVGIQASTQQRQIVKTYDYPDENNKLLYQTVRFKPKNFMQRRTDGKGGFIWNLKETPLVPYSLPAVLEADSVVATEGEKDADILTALGFTATCNPMGAGKWRHEFNKHFKGKRVAILQDNDEPGRRHAQQVAVNLQPIAESVKVIELPGLREKGDVTDWINTQRAEGKDDDKIKRELIEIIKQTLEWEEPKEEELIDSIPTLSEMASKDCTVKYIVEDLIPEQSITILYAPGGRGKTTLMIQVGHCVAEGIPFEGLTTKKTSVIYIDFDNPLNVIVEKAKRLGGGDNFYYWHVSHGLRPSKMDKNEWEIYKRLPQGSLLIFDTLKSCQGLDMNKDETMAFILERFRELRDMGFTIVLLHHTPKGSDTTPKNSTTITDNADHVLGLVPQEVDGEKDGILRFGCGDNDKSRYPKRHICLSFDGEVFEGVPDPDDARLLDMQNLIESLSQEGLPNQSRIVTRAKDRFGFNRTKTLNILNRGVGKYWKCTQIKEHKNQKVYALISVVQMSEGIGLTTEQLPENNKSVAQTTPSTDPQQHLENIELFSCQGGIRTTPTTGFNEAIQLSGISGQPKQVPTTEIVEVMEVIQ